jgi:hypothetical protein
MVSRPAANTYRGQVCPAGGQTLRRFGGAGPRGAIQRQGGGVAISMIRASSPIAAATPVVIARCPALPSDRIQIASSGSLMIALYTTLLLEFSSKRSNGIAKATLYNLKRYREREIGLVS